MKRTTNLATLLAVLALCSFLITPRVLAATQSGGNLDWAYYGNDLGNMRFVDVDQINTGNADQLQPAWIFHTGISGEPLSFESQPIIVGGTLYVSSPHDHVYALDAATGALKWTYTPDEPTLHDLAICCGQTNRGVAVGNGKVFVGQLDATLVALDATTGKQVWKVAVDDWRQRWTETMAPQFVNGKVLIGASGGEFDVRGHLVAYDADSGHELWRFFTVPGPGEPGNNTWAGNSWQSGGAPVWSTPAVDPALGLVYFGTGNAGHDVDGSDRTGDNLYSASVVAVDLDTGQYRWHFQEVHHDIWDYDGPEPTSLFTVTKDGQQIPALGHANKDGYYFILDRRTGQPIFPVNEVPVPTDPAWQHASPTQPESTIDPLIPHSVSEAKTDFPAAPFWTPPSEKPQLFQPGAESGPSWAPAAYSPRTHFSYIPAGGYEPWVFFAHAHSPNALGSVLSDMPSYPDGSHYGLFDAIDTTTGKMAWQMNVPERVASGATVAGDLVFFGESNGKFHGLDAQSGKTVWTYQSSDKDVGGANGAPAVYMVNGREYVAMAFGGNTQVRSGQNSPPGDALIAFALPQAGARQPNVVRATPQDLEQGEPPDSGQSDILKEAPVGAAEVKLETHDIVFNPNHFSVPPGSKVAIDLKNDEVANMKHNFFIALPSGWVGMKGEVNGGEEGYFVFTAPTQPGTYIFWCDVEGHRFVGMAGTMTVDASLAAPVVGPSIAGTIELPRSGQMSDGAFVRLAVPPAAAAGGGQPGGTSPGMPRTGAGDGASLAWLVLAVVAGVLLLLVGLLVLRRHRYPPGA
jgi:quinohemoprotein ethanol dehydrogenase